MVFGIILLFIRIVSFQILNIFYLNLAFSTDVFSLFKILISRQIKPIQVQMKSKEYADTHERNEIQ